MLHTVPTYGYVCQERKAVTDQNRTRADAKQETREALIAAALAEIAEHGLDAPSLDAICARAGYTRGAFYVHFKDRADLLAAVVDQAMTVFMDAVIATGGEGHDLERTIDRFAAAVVDAVAGGRPAEASRKGKRRGPPPRSALPLPAGVPFARVLEGVTRDPRLRAGFTSLLVGAASRLAAIAGDEQRAGALRAHVDAVQIGTLLVLVALGATVALDVEFPVAPAALRDTVVRLLSRYTG
jgi:TetR/AcrR family transcriptional repressor of nem operon